MSLITDPINFVGNSSLKTGNAYRIPFYVKNSDKSPLDLTNYTAKCDIKKYYDDVPVYSPNVIFIDRPNGLIHIVFDGRITRNIKPKVYLYDVFIFDPNGSPLSVVEGFLEFSWCSTIF